MFFSLSTEKKNNFSHCYPLGDLYLNTDAGWSRTDLDHYTLVYKGYADDFDLTTEIKKVIDQNDPEFTGNFCVFVYDRSKQRIYLKSDVWRSFPIFLHGTQITNLEPSDKVVWCDDLVSVDQRFDIDRRNFDAIGNIDTTTISLDDAVSIIHEILCKKAKNFLSHNRLPLRTHLSGGVDSLLVFSLIKKYTSDYEMVTARHFDYDKFWLLNDTQITKNFWGYSQIHHWREPCVLNSGAPGDEFMLRSPVTVDLLCKYRGTPLLNLLEKRPKSLHKEYFYREKHIEIFKNQTIDPGISARDFYWDLCNIVINDWQHWHIGNTLTWTPLRDLEIFKTMLRVDSEEIVDQILDSKISKILIDENVPGMSGLISDDKNHYNPMKNLIDFLFDDPR